MSQLNASYTSPQECIDALNLSLNGSGPLKYGTGLKDRNAAYSKGSGYGVMIRGCLDGQPFSHDGKKSQIVATFLHNDINCPSMIYPYSNTGDANPKDKVATLAAVWDLNPYSNVKYMQDVFPYMKDVQTDPTWGWGVFYAHDSNSLDKRAYPAFQEWIADGKGGATPNENGDWGYDAPGGWQDKSETNKESYDFTLAKEKVGTSDKKVGNPDGYWKTVKPTTPATLWQGTQYGAGAGIHVANHYDDAIKGDPSNFWSFQTGMNTHVHQFLHENKIWNQKSITGYWGEINYDLKGSDGRWDAYVDKVAPFATQIFKIRGKVQWAQDWLIPWVNNFRDLINLNTALADDSNRIKANGWYIEDSKLWGWNEIPIDSFWQDASTVTLFAFVLPQDNTPKTSTIYDHFDENIIWEQINQYHEVLKLLGENSYIAICQQSCTEKKPQYFYKQFILEDFSVTGKNGQGNQITYTVKNGKLSIS